MSTTREGYHRRTGAWQPSAAQRRILDGLAAGRTNAELAAELRLSPETVKWHVAQLLAETGCADRRALGRWWEQRPTRPPLVIPVLGVALRGAATVAALALGVLLLVAGVGTVARVASSRTPPPRPVGVARPPEPSPSPTAVPSPSPSPTPVLAANQQPPLTTFQRYVAALNQGDVDGAVATFAVDGRLADLLCRPEPECVGHAAIRRTLEARVASHRCITVRRAEEAGSVVTAQVEVRADEIRRVGVEHIVLLLTVQVGGDQIVTLATQADQGDENTRRYTAIGVRMAPEGTPLPAPATPCG